MNETKIKHNFDNEVTIYSMDEEKEELIVLLIQLIEFRNDYKRLQKQNAKLKKENERLKNNWNELKEWLQERKFVFNITGEDLDEDTSITEVLIKLLEISKGEDR